MTYALISSIVANILAILAAVFGVMCLKRLNHVIKLQYKRPFFIFIVTGIVLYAIAETIKTIFEFILGLNVFPSIADIFHMGAAIALVIGFIYFWVVSKAWSKFHTKDWFLFFAGLALSAGYLAYLFFGIIIPDGMHHSGLLNFLNFFYPITSTLVFTLSYVLHTHYREGLVRRAYLYLAQGIFFIFMADMFLSYITWMGEYGVSGVLSDTFYVIGYLLLGVSMFIFHGKSKQ